MVKSSGTIKQVERQRRPSYASQAKLAGFAALKKNIPAASVLISLRADEVCKCSFGGVGRAVVKRQQGNGEKRRSEAKNRQKDALEVISLRLWHQKCGIAMLTWKNKTENEPYTVSWNHKQ